MTTWPSNDWRTRRISPAPWQSGQTTGSVPGAVPRPVQAAQVAGKPDRDLLAAAEDGLGELQADPHLGVGPGCRSTPAAAPARHLAEERLENVTQASLEAEAARAGLASEDALGAEAVVASPLLGVAEDLVGHRDLLELGLGRGVTRIGVGVELTGPGPVGLLDLVVAGLGPDSQEPVEVA